VNCSDVVDLYAFRCAVAAVVHARHHIEQLATADIARADDAVRHLVAVAAELGGELATATGWLLSADPDPGGRRTVRAVDRLAALTHVDPATAPALAASLHRPRHPVQPTLFDINPPTQTTA
jgi:hypothetical protein